MVARCKGGVLAAGAALQASKHGDKIVKAVEPATQFTESFFVPGPPSTMTGAGMAGYFTNEAGNRIKKQHNKKPNEK